MDRPNLYGSEQHLLRLMELVKVEHEISVLVFNDGPLLELIRSQGIPINIIHVKWHSLSKVSKLREFIGSGNFDVVHAHQPKALFWASIAAKLSKIPCVITMHSLPSSNMQSYHNLLKKVAVGVFHYTVKTIAELLATKVVYLSKFSYASALFKKK